MQTYVSRTYSAGGTAPVGNEFCTASSNCFLSYFVFEARDPGCKLAKGRNKKCLFITMKINGLHFPQAELSVGEIIALNVPVRGMHMGKTLHKILDGKVGYYCQ